MGVGRATRAVRGGVGASERAARRPEVDLEARSSKWQARTARAVKAARVARAARAATHPSRGWKIET